MTLIELLLIWWALGALGVIFWELFYATGEKCIHSSWLWFLPMIIAGGLIGPLIFFSFYVANRR